MTNSNDDGRNSSDGRVYTPMQSSGSIHEVAREQGSANYGHVGGLNSGLSAEEHASLHSRGGEGAVRVRTGGETRDLGGYTARSADGSAITNAAELRDDSVITLANGYETDYASLKEAGIPLGDRQTEQQQEPSEQELAEQEQRAEQAREQTDGLGPEAYKVMKGALDKAEGTVLDTAMEIINSEDGVISDQGVVALADALGVQPEQARQHVTTVLAGYERDAVQAAHNATGLHPELVTEALRDAFKSRPSEFREAAQRHLNEGGAEAYNTFALDYVARLAETEPHRLIGKDLGSVRPYAGPNGEVLVKTNGGVMSWQDYIHGGFHKGRR